MKNAILEQARQFVRNAMKDEASGHDWWHIHRVTQLAGKLAREEGADSYVCELAALFHDLADEKLVADKEEGLKNISAWLSRHGVTEKDNHHIMDIISTMSYQGGHGVPMKTIEGKVVQDADRLDALGAIGIARTFSYNGHKGNLMYDPDLTPRETMSKEEYRNGKSTAVNHFHEKLLKLKDLMNTDTAKKMAESRHQFMLDYLSQFHKEWNAQD